jgi:hypothetical protein
LLGMLGISERFYRVATVGIVIVLGVWLVLRLVLGQYTWAAGGLLVLAGCLAIIRELRRH